MLISYEGQDFKEVIDRPGLVLVDFYATWCGPCKMLMPQLEALSEEQPQIPFVKVDIDQHKPLAKETYGVTSVPTLVLFKDGVEVSRQSGFAPKDAVFKWIQANK
ncbi:thioredoxin 1 [Acholeplasma morum]|uniref:thioredoxin n=1 Tax=Paracholeplasma morum TaxID=264637 RepID=UPI00195D7F7A|nr:thioredoxin [Paracholeplasma morum]MBM7453623.1 thioredoxin 1 [Paracholeplasma morum]